MVIKSHFGSVERLRAQYTSPWNVCPLFPLPGSASGAQITRPASLNPDRFVTQWTAVRFSELCREANEGPTRAAQHFEQGGEKRREPGRDRPVGSSKCLPSQTNPNPNPNPKKISVKEIWITPDTVGQVGD